MLKITEGLVSKYKSSLVIEEKAPQTIQKYVRDVERFGKWMKGCIVTKEMVLRYKEELLHEQAPSSVNSVLSSLNSFFTFAGKDECKVKSIRIQRQLFASENTELTKQEYGKLLASAQMKKDKRLYCLMQTVCATGIRISEDI